MEYYIEYIMIEEMCIDFILLYITGNLLKKKLIIKRLLAASIVGLCYSIAVLIIKREFLNFFVVKLTVSILMITIAYNPLNLLDYLKTTVCFYMVSLFIVGVVLALNNLFNSKITIVIILISILIAYMAIKFIFLEIRKKSQNREYLRKVIITYNGSEIKLCGYIDTGNELKDALSNRPVIITSMKSIKEFFPDRIYREIQDYYKKKSGYYDFILKYSDAYDFRLLRYSTISDTSGYLFGFIPDKVVVEHGNVRIEVDCVIGLYPRELSKDNTFQALLFKKMLDWENENESEFCNGPL